MSKQLLALVTEGEFQEFEELDSMDEACAFASGFSCGAGYYGCGSAWAYLVPQELPEMDESVRVEVEKEWKERNEAHS